MHISVQYFALWERVAQNIKIFQAKLLSEIAICYPVQIGKVRDNKSVFFSGFFATEKTLEALKKTYFVWCTF